MTDEEFDWALSFCSVFTAEKPLILPPNLYDALGEECLIRGREMPDSVIAAQPIPLPQPPKDMK